MSVFDLHVHTIRGSGDSSLAPEHLVDQAIRMGLDGVCLTEHSGGWDSEEFDSAFKEACITVIRGLEVDTDMGHVLVFGLPFYINGVHRVEGLSQAVNRAGGVMVSAHPFRNLFSEPPRNPNLLFKDRNALPGTIEEAAAHPLFRLVHAIETDNGSNSEMENQFALEVATYLGLGGTGGSDAHSKDSLGRSVTIFDDNIDSEADLIAALKAGTFHAGKGYPRGT